MLYYILLRHAIVLQRPPPTKRPSVAKHQPQQQHQHTHIHTQSHTVDWLGLSVVVVAPVDNNSLGKHASLVQRTNSGEHLCRDI